MSPDLKVETREAARQDLFAVDLKPKTRPLDLSITDRITGSPLSDILVRAHMAAGNIVIVPFEEKYLQSSSYDVRIGDHYYEEHSPKFDYRIFNPYNPDHVERVWGKKPRKAILAKTLMDKYPRRDYWVNIEPDDRIIFLEPGKTYLCHTIEFIGFRNMGTTMMKARSTLGRDFLEICKCAGWGDNGYINRWTMEVTNNSVEYWIPLIVGTRVAQIVFFYTGPTEKPYPGAGNYQTTDDLKELIQEWKPESMLPRLKRETIKWPLVSKARQLPLLES